jgi:hypothetical protein
MTIRIDLYTKVVLTAIALLLGVLVVRPAVHPAAVAADTNLDLYIEPGAVSLRNLDGSSPGDGKMVVNRRTGEIWGFPTMSPSARFPIDVSSSKPPVSKPIYLGKFDFSAIQ